MFGVQKAAVFLSERNEDTLRCVEPPVLKLTDCSDHLSDHKLRGYDCETRSEVMFLGHAELYKNGWNFHSKWSLKWSLSIKFSWTDGWNFMSEKLIEIQYSSLQVCFKILPPLLLATASLLRIEQAARGSGFWDLRYENSGRVVVETSCRTPWNFRVFCW